MIEITISDSVPSSDWQRLAYKYAKEYAESLGRDYRDLEMLIKLPEGRCFFKYAGEESFGGYR